MEFSGTAKGFNGAMATEKIEFIVPTGKNCAVKSGINLGAFNVLQLLSQQEFVKITISDSKNNSGGDVKQLKRIDNFPFGHIKT